MDSSNLENKKTTKIKSLWNWWKRTARKIGDFQARIILTIFYFLVLAPFSLAIRIGTDPLAIKANSQRGWHLKTNEKGIPMEHATRQF
jgi:hypothetical protein